MPFTLDNLVSIINQKDFVIRYLYVIKEEDKYRIKFIRISKKKNLQIDLLIFVSKKFNAYVEYSKEFVLVQSKEIKPREEDAYESISFQPTEYKSIDVKGEIDDIYNNILSPISSNLIRLQNIISSTKYNVGIITDFTISLIQKNIHHYSVFGLMPCYKFNKKYVLTIGLDEFYNNSTDDIPMILSRIKETIEEGHKKNFSILENMKNYVDKLNKIVKEYDKRKKYETMLEDLTDKYKKINQEITNIEIQEKTQTTYQRLNTEQRKMKMIQLRNDIINLYRDIDKKYSNFLLSFDTLIFDNLENMKQLNVNFESLSLL